MSYCSICNNNNSFFLFLTKLLINFVLFLKMHKVFIIYKMIPIPFGKELIKGRKTCLFDFLQIVPS